MPFAQYVGGGSAASRWMRNRRDEEERYDTDQVNRQIQNAITRIRDAGYDISDADRRNWFERMTNLPEDQNAFFDILELLGRPGSAVKNVIDKSLMAETQDPLTAAWRGFSGQDRVTGAEILERGGVENPLARGILGFGLDVATDPLTFVPGAAFVRAGRAIGSGAKGAARAGLGAVERVSPGFARFRQEVAQPALERARDALGRAFVPDYKLGEDLYGRADDTILRAKQAAENRITYMTDEAMRNVAEAAKTAGGVDTGRDVGRLMERELRQFEDVPMYRFPGDGRLVEDRGELLAEASRQRERLREVGKSIRPEQAEYQKAIGEFAKAIDDTNREINRLFNSIERQVGRELSAAKRKELREARQQLKRIESQLDNFPNVEASMLRAFKKQIRDAHEARFEVLKRIRQVAPNGVRMIEGAVVPDRLRGYVRNNGKPIDEVANELGYQYADDLLQEIAALNNVPRKLTSDEVERLARAEMERVGALEELRIMRSDLEGAHGTLQQLIQDITAHVPDVEGRAFAELAQNQRWQELEAQRKALLEQHAALRNESRQAKQARLQEIRRIENEITALREAAKTPVTVQREIPRPQREYSTDPAIQEAARNLMRSNQELRQWALANGVSIGELEGYMKHVLSRAERQRRQKVRAMPIDRGNRGIGQPNKKVIQSRELMGSAEDVNERLGREFFEPNAYFATAIGQKQLIEYVNAATFRRQVLSNPSFAIPYQKGMEIPKNAVVIDTNKYKFLPDDMGELAQEIGGEYIVTKSVKTALDRYKKLTSDEGIDSFLKAFDTMQSAWKRMALFSPLYHLRNDIGAKFNNWVGGMSLPNLVKYSNEANKEVYNAVVRGIETPMFQEYRQQGLYRSGLSAVEFARRGEEPEEAIRRTIEKRSRLDGTLGGRLKVEFQDLKNPLNVFETSRQFADFVDQTNRYALYLWARKAKGMSPEQAANKVREVQFDYSRVTPFEQEFMTRLMPFYRWMRNNLPFQVRQFINDPRKYIAVDKLRLNAQEAVGIDEENVPDWMKESFAIPVYGEGGSGKFLGLNLPIGDLARATEPGRMAFDAVSPLLTLPAELVMNRDFFYDKPIQRFEGEQKQFQVPFGGPEFGVDPTLAYVLEEMTGQIGRGLSGYLKKPEEVDQDTKYRMPTLGISGLLKDFDAEAAEYFERRDELQRLMDLINFIEQQEGVRPRTIREIQAGAR